MKPGIDAHLALHDIPVTAATVLGARGVEVVGPKVSRVFVLPPPWSTRKPAADSVCLQTNDAPSSWPPRGESVRCNNGRGPDCHRDSNPGGGLREQLRPAQHAAQPPGRSWLGWVEMPDLMRADLVIQNAGGLISSKPWRADSRSSPTAPLRATAKPTPAPWPRPGGRRGRAPERTWRSRRMRPVQQQRVQQCPCWSGSA